MNYQLETNGVRNSNSDSDLASLRAEISSIKRKSSSVKSAVEGRGFNRETTRVDNTLQSYDNTDELSAISKYKNRSNSNVVKESVNDKSQQRPDVPRNSDSRAENLDTDSSKNENHQKLGNRYKPQANNSASIVDTTKFAGDSKAVKKVQIKNTKKSTRGMANHAIEMQPSNKVTKPKRRIFRKIDFYSVFVTLVTAGIIQGGLIYFFILR